MSVERALDRLVLAGRISGHTLEEDPAYVWARSPTLTYRMYAHGGSSWGNLGEFVAGMSDLGGEVRVTRVLGTVAGLDGELVRSRQLCVSARFQRASRLERALALVEERFYALQPACAPGSWVYPDVRVTGMGSDGGGTIPAFAHCWPGAEMTPVVLTLSPAAPVRGAVTRAVQVLECWRALLAEIGTMRDHAWRGKMLGSVESR